jgi:hypothetical protein
MQWERGLTSVYTLQYDYVGRTFNKSPLPFGDEAFENSSQDPNKGESSSYRHDVVASQVSGDGRDIVNRETYGAETVSDKCEIIRHGGGELFVW